MPPIVAHLTEEEQLLADAILRHRPLALAPALQADLRVAGQYVPEGQAALLHKWPWLKV
ncbi:hypothetical protein MUN81_22260 (plasmid) [Hymenobacter sp. 5317J-9]|uniref:hypothetical protein n=1 Tax=Hymenobacter sp. 5317J-9 TaxID=2932250 RepID=UPI001FD67C6C|nr:hypothetical protein [Hymenobacter sp. 5317J-9]UOR00113.1 hypothetical protein MUN81_22260 [Hymenobacter sp. 5317J-9]